MSNNPRDALLFSPDPTIQLHIIPVLEQRGHQVSCCPSLDDAVRIVRSGQLLRIVAVAMTQHDQHGIEALQVIQRELLQRRYSSMPQFLLVSFIAGVPKLEIEANRLGAHFVSAIHSPYEELIRKVELINALLDDSPFVTIEHT